MVILPLQSCFSIRYCFANMSDVIERIEYFVQVWAEWLLERQVTFNTPISSLHELKVHSALHGGRMFDTSRIARNPWNTHLWKVGLIGDVILGDGERLSTLKVRQGLENRSRFLSKFQRHLAGHSPSRLRRIAYFSLGKLIHHNFCSANFNPHIDIDWALVPGVNFLEQGDGSFLCIDYGSIYEDFLTTDSCRYPSQVGIDLYTTSNAAYLFKWMHDFCGSAKWNVALSATKAYFQRFYQTPRQRLEFDHREFNYTALRITFGKFFTVPFQGWTFYDPVNVFGLRWDNMAQAPEIRTKMRMAVSRWMIVHNQTRDGLIRDNHLGRAIEANDLTYHQYCLASLALGNIIIKDEKIDRVVQLGLRYSVSLQLANGEVSYYGRGANNIYHLAAYISAMSVAAYSFRWDVSAILKISVERLYKFLNPSLSDRRFPPLPTAMNDSAIQNMIGWHGSCAQYGAQSAYFMARGLPFLRRATSYKNKLQPITPARIVCNPVHAQIRAGFGKSQISLCLTSGGDSVSWSNGRHVSGFSGLTALLIGDRNHLLTNELVAQDNNRSLLLADITNQSEHDRGRLRLYDKSARLFIHGRYEKRNAYYEVNSGGWAVMLSNSLSPVSYCLPLEGEILVSNVKQCSFSLTLADATKVSVTLDKQVSTKIIPIKKSCHGSGVLLCVSAAERKLSLFFTVKF